MNITVFAFTRRGTQLAERMSLALRGNGHTVSFGDSEYGLMRAAAEAFASSDALVFTGACGIAVRAVAPHLRGKMTDPAVIVCDESAQFVIPLLSGHVGGANALAEELASITGAVAVITTATDVNGVFAADTWAVRQGLRIRNPEMIKHISSALLEGEAVGLHSECAVKGALPQGVCRTDNARCGIFIGISDMRPFEFTLSLAPRDLVVGCGCRKGVAGERIVDVISSVLRENALESDRIWKLCSIDIKRGEPGLLSAARHFDAKIAFFTASELAAVEGDFTVSELVRRVTGVDNVCERSAVLCGGEGELIVKKQSRNGVTTAVFRRNFEVVFNG